jgi:hypothetical protein
LDLVGHCAGWMDGNWAGRMELKTGKKKNRVKENVRWSCEMVSTKVGGFGLRRVNWRAVNSLNPWHCQMCHIA